MLRLASQLTKSPILSPICQGCGCGLTREQTGLKALDAIGLLEAGVRVCKETRIRAWQMNSPVACPTPVTGDPIGISDPVAWATGWSSLTPRFKWWDLGPSTEHPAQAWKAACAWESCRETHSLFLCSRHLSRRGPQRQPATSSHRPNAPRPLDDPFTVYSHCRSFSRPDNDPAGLLSPILWSQADQSRSFP